MSIFKRLKKSFDSSKNDAIKEESSKRKAPEPAWKNPLDQMPIANGSTNRYAPPGRLEELEAELVKKNTMVVEENPRPEEEMAEWFSDKKENPDESDTIEEEKTMHQKMYEIATARYNPFSIGGSENCDSDVSCNIGGSENHIEKEPPDWEDTAPSEYEP